ncbi:TioE family transcriptional regulator [Halalkalibacterium halodurans]|uniref:TioE family transcriptional regulator n=1 Tax=Halalkalibacterium halodurans TaxID=86665 RepID=UPI002AAA3C34|nr:TioE family transcriptional regulator [Halalkalibacterium halodurans]MDY7224148.1 TioE family transcriptional regulator [Halalkalibacterium halodurans]MDY7243433.1 TioE family transcriptional regulator [Halalkalibacterium halodurans]MED4081987.1 TioE family transcriptional regulator [Halalkalibacterium halodurans]MED4083631.1 TioE family transcriptional regulator [Halalkalibacterium halodurans]MED4106615.1 TioE family transcriptional regulator [Halalkalibacterium halodurans]
MRYFKPKEIADELHISTSALRHYESWGVVPAPERAENGYRLYTKVHLAYFRCLRSMVPGFGYQLTYDVLRHIQKKEMNEAFWLVNEEQAKLHEEKRLADQTLAMLQEPDVTTLNNRRIKNKMTIGEAAELTNVQTSAIRHWEKEGLLSPERNPENGYRLYTPVHIRQILLIRTLRKTVYFLDKMKEVVDAVEHQRIEKAKKITEEALVSIHQRNRQQFNGVHQMIELCIEVGMMEYNDPSLLYLPYQYENHK